jgi:hypothetical protein
MTLKPRRQHGAALATQRGAISSNVRKVENHLFMPEYGSRI